MIIETPLAIEILLSVDYLINSSKNSIILVLVKDKVLYLE